MNTNEPESKQLPKLYRLRSVIPCFEYAGTNYKDVEITWCVEKRKEPVIPYKDGIKDYEPSPNGYVLYEEIALDELFTEIEVKVFEAYILNVYNDDTVQREEVDLPIVKESSGYTCNTFGGGLDCRSLYKAPSYCLSFPVCGVFNVRHGEVIGEVETKEDKCLCPFEHMAVHESIRHDQAMEDIETLNKLKESGNLKIQVRRGNGYFEYPCDICRQRNETAGVADIELVLPVGIKLNRRLFHFVCTGCGMKYAPQVVKLRDELRQKIDAYMLAQHEMEELENSIPSIVAERKKAQAIYESEHGDGIPF